MNRKKFREQYIRRFKDSGAPIIGLFELTGRCNFDCKMCYVHTKSNAEFLKTEKSGDWWIEQMDAACDNGMLFATLTGGECFLHPDFQRIYTHLRQRGVYVDVKTNGLLLTQKNIEFLKKDPPFEIQLTVYGADEDGYEKVTGVRAFHQVEESIKRVIDAGLNIKISITPNSYAPGETEKIIDYVKGLKIPYGITETLLTTFDDTSPRLISEKNVEIEERIRFLRKRKGVATQPIPEEELPPFGGKQTQQVRGLKCSAGRVAFAISYDGQMRPCGMLHHLRVPLETAEDFTTAWNQMKEIGKTFLLPVECEGCAYIKACQSCPVVRSGKAGNGHCDPAVCEMTRKLVAAGVRKLDQQEAAESEHTEI